MNLNIPIKLIDNVCKKRDIQTLSDMLYEYQSELTRFWIENKCSQYVRYECKDPENPCAYASESGCTHPDHPMKKFKSKLENPDGVRKFKTEWSNETVEIYLNSQPEGFRISIITATLAIRNQLNSTKDILKRIINEAPGEGINIISPASLAITESDQESLIKAVSLIDTVILRLSSQFEIGMNTFKKV